VPRLIFDLEDEGDMTSETPIHIQTTRHYITEDANIYQFYIPVVLSKSSYGPNIGVFCV
jgi:hypothetical protein